MRLHFIGPWCSVPLRMKVSRGPTGWALASWWRLCGDDTKAHRHQHTPLFSSKLLLKSEKTRKAMESGSLAEWASKHVGVAHMLCDVWKEVEKVGVSGSLFVRPSLTPERDKSNSVWWDRQCLHWLGSVTDDQVTKAEDVTAARLSVSNHRSLFTYLIGAALPKEFSAYIFRLFAVPRGATTWLHYSDQSASNWSLETKSAVLFYSILFTTYVDVWDRSVWFSFCFIWLRGYRWYWQLCSVRRRASSLSAGQIYSDH